MHQLSLMSAALVLLKFAWRFFTFYLHRGGNQEGQKSVINAYLAGLLQQAGWQAAVCGRRSNQLYHLCL
jgi:hypothetical protein